MTTTSHPATPTTPARSGNLTGGSYDLLTYTSQLGLSQVGVYGTDGRLVGFVRDESGSSWFPTEAAAYLALSAGAEVS